MAWQYNGWCHDTEAELIGALRGSPPVIGGRLDNFVSHTSSTDGNIFVDAIWYNGTSQQTTSYTLTFSACDTPGPMYTDQFAITLEQMPLYSGAVALMFCVAYCGRMLRRAIERAY